MTRNKVTEFIILAGGDNSRLQVVTNGEPKTLMNVNGTTILGWILKSIDYITQGEACVYIMAHKHHERINQYITTFYQDALLDVKVIYAPYSPYGNAGSLLAAKPAVKNSDFFVMMSDHLIEPKGLAHALTTETPMPFVCVDPKNQVIPPPFYLDLDDATKIAVTDQGTIENIGKAIPQWNAIDMGLFHLTTEVFDWISALSCNKWTLSNVVQAYCEKKVPFYTHELQGVRWKDIDTPRDLSLVRRLMRMGFLDFSKTFQNRRDDLTSDHAFYSRSVDETVEDDENVYPIM